MEIQASLLNDRMIERAVIVVVYEPGYRNAERITGAFSMVWGGTIWPLYVIVAPGTDDREQVIARVRRVKGCVDMDKWKAAHLPITCPRL